jgi:hypothetical protein
MKLPLARLRVVQSMRQVSLRGSGIRNLGGFILCLARALLAAPFGPSAMCFLRTSQCFGWHGPNINHGTRRTTPRNQSAQNSSEPMPLSDAAARLNLGSCEDDDPPNAPERRCPRRHGRKYPPAAGRPSAKIGRRRPPARGLRLGERANSTLRDESGSGIYRRLGPVLNLRA